MPVPTAAPAKPAGPGLFPASAPRLRGCLRPAVLALITCLIAIPTRAAQDDLRLEVARQWAEKGDYEKAVQELRLFLNEHPEAAEVYARIGSLRLRQGKLPQAAENFKVALQKDPSLAEAKEGMAKLKELESQPSTAANPGAGFTPSLESETAGSPQGIYALPDFQQALRQYQEGKADQAVASLKRVLAQSPGHPGAYYLGGVIRYDKGDLAKAAYNFKRSFDYPERGFNAHFYLGRIHQRQNRIPEAIAHFEKYLAATKSEAGRRQVENILAQLRAKPGTSPAASVSSAPEHADAAPEHQAGNTAPPASAHGAPAQAAPAKGPQSPDAQSHGGQEAHAGADSSQAVPPAAARSPMPLVLGLEGAPPFVVADSAGASGKLLMDAYAAFRKEKFEKSADLLKEAVRRFGGSPNAEAADLDLASVYVRLGLWDNARDRILSYLAQARQPQRFRDLAFYLEGLMYLGRKDAAEAERALLKVKAGGFGGPAQDEVDWRLAQAGEMMKDKKKWAAYLERAHASARTGLRKARLSQQLGQLHGSHGRPERALEFYRKSLEVCVPGASADTGDGRGELCTESQLRIADLQFRRKDWKEAMAGYRRFASDNPGHKEAAWAQYQIGNVFQATGNLESALNQYKKVIDNYPDSYWASQARWKREDAIWRKEYEEVLD